MTIHIIKQPTFWEIYSLLRISKPA